MAMQTSGERLAEVRRLREESRDAFNKFFDYLLKERSDLERVADEELGILQCGSDSLEDKICNFGTPHGR